MTLHRDKLATTPLPPTFLVDRRDRRPGTHFARDLGPTPKRMKLSRADRDAHVDEDLGCSAFGIDLPLVPRG
ncbi:MAG: hypothetical protein ACRELA_04000 [Candidatus Rokuibacteriota bacterium]